VEERYDFVAPRDRLESPAVIAFRELLAAPETQNRLRKLGFLQ
jgi:putative molybdopterin biosynthesis protein